MFKDSWQFLQGSLDTLVRNLANSYTSGKDKLNAFPFLADWLGSHLDHLDPEGSVLKDILSNLLKKGVYPYTWAKTYEDLESCNELPPIEAFTSELRGPISPGEYKRAQWFWRWSECQSMLDFTLRYNELDVIGMASVMQAFRTPASRPYPEGYGLDPVHFPTLPSYSWHALMYMNMRKGVKVETIPDTDDGMGALMFGMAESGIRGGICQVLHPFAHANPMPEEEVHAMAPDPLDPLSGETTIEYDDENNLYGAALSEPMPLDDFRVVKKSKDHAISMAEWDRRYQTLAKDFGCSSAPEGSVLGLDHNQLVLLERDLWWLNPDMDQLNAWVAKELGDEDPYAYLVDVDVIIPKELHDYLADYPPFPENKLPPDPSPHTCSEYEKQDELATAFRCRKLILDLNDKKGYVIHSRLLQFYVQLGCRISAVNRVVSFRQSRWIADYISYNTEKRKKAANDIDSNTYKFMSNATFGKVRGSLGLIDFLVCPDRRQIPQG